MDMITIIDNYGWDIEIDDFFELTSQSIIDKLKSCCYSIFYNANKDEYWSLKFCIDGVWFKTTCIDIDTETIYLRAERFCYSVF